MDGRIEKKHWNVQDTASTVGAPRKERSNANLSPRRSQKICSSAGIKCTGGDALPGSRRSRRGWQLEAA
jgi:hypothetical protein